MGMFSYIKSRIGSAGIGADDMGFVQTMNLTPASIYGPRYNVRLQLAPQAPGFVKMGQQIVPVSILGDSGLGLQGTFALNPLATPNKG
jgi:hypothetical protein